MARRHYLSIHFLRIMACLMVILIHISATPVVTLSANSLSSVFFILINQIAKPAVPIFIFISGFLLHNVYKGKPLSPFSYWKKRLPKLVIPYVLWSLAYYLLYMKMGYYPRDIKFVLKGLLLGTFIYHLYFMVIIIQFYIIYPLLHYLIKYIGEKRMFIVVLAIQMAMISVPFAYRDRFFTTYFCYFALGILLNAHLPILKKSKSRYILYFTGFVGIGILNSALFLNSQNGWIALPSIAHSLLYVLLSTMGILTLMFGFEYLSVSISMSATAEARTSILGDATQLIYYAHPLFILGSDYIMNYLGILSISLRAVSALLFIVMLLVPFSYSYKKVILKRNINTR